MAQVRFAKYPRLVWLVRYIETVGYEPQIIICYRAPAGFLQSAHKRRMLAVPELLDEWYQIYSTALLQLGIYGGAAVGYEEITDLEQTRWADAISSVAGLDPEVLLNSRQELVKPKTHYYPVSVSHEQANLTYEELLNLQGKVFLTRSTKPPSAK